MKTFLALAFLTATAVAGPRTSTNYSVATDAVDAGGKRVTSASYTNDGSAGGITGISTVATPLETVKHGYMGQLTEVTALQLAATPVTVGETATRQLSAAQVLDDLTTVALPASSVSWSVQSGPLSSINASGLATASTVYENTTATAKGIYAGLTGTLDLTVTDSITDNYGSYAGDNIGDDWQFQYFGLDNANAAPLVDLDGDGQNNAFEFTAGLVPTDAQSRFLTTIVPVPGQLGQKSIVFNPVVAGRNYTVLTSLDLSAGSWNPLSGAIIINEGTQRTVTDPTASEAKKFYRVEIEKP